LERVDRTDPRYAADTRRIRERIAHHAAQTPAGLPSGLIHGDLFRDNVLWSDGGARPAEPGAAAPGTEPGGPGRPRAPAQQLVALLDFESASAGAFVYD